MRGEDWNDWEAETDHSLLIKCVGYNFGPNPETRLNDIREARGGYGWTVAHRMRLSKNDTVLDLGSGCGFVGRTIAPLVRHLHCADLSRSFLGFCERELAAFPNVTCHLISYADLSSLHSLGIGKVYSTAVWIHFNFYDLINYLTALNAILPIGGTVYFDYADPDGIDLETNEAFQAHAAGYRADRSRIVCLLNYNSREAVKVALDLTGFALDGWWRTHADCCSVLATKRAQRRGASSLALNAAL